MEYLLKVIGLTVKLIFKQHICHKQQCLLYAIVGLYYSLSIGKN